MNSGKVRAQPSAKWLTHHGNKTNKPHMWNDKVGMYIGLPEWQEVRLNYGLCSHTIFFKKFRVEEKLVASSLTAADLGQLKRNKAYIIIP